MEDGLSLSLSLNSFETMTSSSSDPSPKEAHSESKEGAPNTTLNLGWMGESSKAEHEGDGGMMADEGDAVVISSGSDGADGGEGGGEKKKLRLSKEQSTLLEDTFLEHSTLNNKQKLHLAEQLNLKPRQVEVWFQNRRARTKLKQTEVDCETLRKYCARLCEENKRLHRELQELRSANRNALVLCHACGAYAAGPRHTAAATATAATAAAFSRPAVNPNGAGPYTL